MEFFTAPFLFDLMSGLDRDRLLVQLINRKQTVHLESAITLWDVKFTFGQRLAVRQWQESVMAAASRSLNKAHIDTGTIQSDTHCNRNREFEKAAREAIEDRRSNRLWKGEKPKIH